MPEIHTQIQTSRSANIVFVYVPKHYECRSSEMYVCILQWLLKSLAGNSAGYYGYPGACAPPTNIKVLPP